MIKEMICISCPMGCHLTVDDSDKNDIKVSGNTCPRGRIYGINEVTAPKRMVTSSVEVTGSDAKRVSVKTSEPVPKEQMFECLDVIRTITAAAPVRIGDVLYKNVCGSGADIVATRNADKI